MASEQAGPTGLADRALAPDLARGCMLLFIAVANSHHFLRGESALGGFPQGGSALDAVVTALITTFVDGRAFPLFGFLFGYGVAQIVRRQITSGAPWRAVRRLLWRRSAFLVALGLLDAVLLYVGDILGAYGVLLFAGVWALRWKDRTLLIVAGLFLVMTALAADPVSTDPPSIAELPPDPWAALTQRIVVAPVIALLGPLGFATPFLIGIWAGRRRIIERPEQHLRLLRWTAFGGLTVAVVGGLPLALTLSGASARPDADTLATYGSMHDALGLFGGLGYAALIALIAVRIGRPRGRVTLAVSATGQRSLTCYLTQSVVWAVVFTPYLLNLSGTLTVASTALLAAGTWLGTVIGAEAMRRAGYRGPFETLIRRFTYRRRQ